MNGGDGISGRKPLFPCVHRRFARTVMFRRPRCFFHVAPDYQPILREIGLDADAVFSHPAIRIWRNLDDRENGTLDALLADGRHLRLHIKRYRPVFSRTSPADAEAGGLHALMSHDIPAAPLVGWGGLDDGRSFVIIEDLADYRPSDRLLEDGFPFVRLLEPTADLAARLHNAGLHHRDLYLCHFMARPLDDAVDLRLIDAARVRRLSRLFRGRWIVKDLAQFWYSTLVQPITDSQRIAWLTRYAAQRQIDDITPLARRIQGKIAWMARHDARLNRKQPHRNVPIPAD